LQKSGERTIEQTTRLWQVTQGKQPMIRTDVRTFKAKTYLDGSEAGTATYTTVCADDFDISFDISPRSATRSPRESLTDAPAATVVILNEEAPDDAKGIFSSMEDSDIVVGLNEPSLTIAPQPGVQEGLPIEVQSKDFESVAGPSHSTQPPARHRWRKLLAIILFAIISGVVMLVVVLWLVLRPKETGAELTPSCLVMHASVLFHASS
jgi:hypothetical protein